MKSLFTWPLLAKLPKELRLQARENAAKGKPLNPMLDVVFKSLFSGKSEDSRKALISLLSDCIHRPVRDVLVHNNEFLPEHLTGKTARLDVHVTFNDGEQADLEMQIGRNADDLRTRALFYAAKLLSGQLKRGEKYRHIKRVYSIFFLNCVLFPGGSKVPRRYFVKEETEHDRLTEALEIIFYEMPKLEEKALAYCEGREEVKNLQNEEKWCMFFRYRQEEKMAGLIAELCREKEGIMHAESALSKMNRDYEKWARAFNREMAEIDYHSGLAAAREDGELAGLAKGYEQARQEARLEKLEIARKMKAAGIQAEQISAITGLPAETAEKV